MVEGSTLTGERAPAEDRGRLVIAPRVVERIATAAAGEVPGTVSVSSTLQRITSRGLPRADATVAGTQTRVDCSVAVLWPAALSEVALAVRDRVAARVSELSSLQVDGVGVLVSQVVYRPHGEVR